MHEESILPKQRPTKNITCIQESTRKDFRKDKSERAKKEYVPLKKIDTRKLAKRQMFARNSNVKVDLSRCEIVIIDMIIITSIKNVRRNVLS